MFAERNGEKNKFYKKQKVVGNKRFETFFSISETVNITTIKNSKKRVKTLLKWKVKGQYKNTKETKKKDLQKDKKHR